MEPDVDASILVLHHDDEARLSHVKVLEAAGYVVEWHAYSMPQAAPGSNC